MILVLHLRVLCLVLLEGAVLLDDVLVVLLLQDIRLSTIPQLLLKPHLALFVLPEEPRVVISHACISLSESVHLKVALLQLILYFAREALTVGLFFHNLLMSLEILRMLIYLSVMLVTESAICIHAAVKVRTHIPERIGKHGHILRSQKTFRGLGCGALETRRSL